MRNAAYSLLVTKRDAISETHDLKAIQYKVCVALDMPLTKGT